MNLSKDWDKMIREIYEKFDNRVNSMIKVMIIMFIVLMDYKKSFLK